VSIRLRLTLLYAALLVLVLVGFSSALYIGHSRRTSALLELSLTNAALRIAQHPMMMMHPLDRSLGPGLLHPRPPVAFIQLRGPDGQVQEKSAGLGEHELPVSPPAATAVAEGRSWSETETIDDERYLVVSVPLESGGDGGMIQVAGSVSMLGKYLSGLRASLIALTVVTVLIAFVSGWMVAGAALRPIERMTQTARRIGEERDFSRRLVHTGPDDELGHLASTFNAMLDALREAYDSLAEALDRQRRFVADASHELRTPLTTIRGNAELLRREPPISDGDRREVVTDIIGETERLMSLVEELLLLARTDSGRHLEIGPVSLAPLLDELRRQVEVIAPGRNVDIANGNGHVVLANETALRQVLLNLLDNAMKHTSQETHIQLTTAALEDRIEISITDDGPGMSGEELEHVFERFYRGDANRTGPGSGLGLAIARSLVESQGGTVRASSEMGVGTTFTVTLPSLPGSETYAQ